jgi:hypothetical protein
MYTYIFLFFYFSYFFIFYFFLFFIILGAEPSSAHMGWAGLDPASPARSLAQASDPAGPHEARVNQITRA